MIGAEEITKALEDVHEVTGAGEFGDDFDKAEAYFIEHLGISLKEVQKNSQDAYRGIITEVGTESAEAALLLVIPMIAKHMIAGLDAMFMVGLLTGRNERDA